MSGAHRTPDPVKKPMTNIHRDQITVRVILSYIFVLVIVATLVSIVVYQTTKHASKSTSTYVSASVTPDAPTASKPLPSLPVPTVSNTSASSASATTTAPAMPVYEQVYIVRPGDNLTRIAQYFHANGYGDIYVWNKALIGSNPNLIHPGQQLIVSPGSPPPVVVNP